MKILALDLGDVWIGSALSDVLGLIATPHQTVKIDQLTSFLQKTLAEYQIQTVVIGLPRTMRGTESEQTKKVIAHKEALEKQFPDIEWVFWDERLTSKQAEGLTKSYSAQEKQRSHARAAAFILQSYLDRQQFLKN